MHNCHMNSKGEDEDADALGLPSSRVMCYREDIDGLRAIAVLSVLFFHASPLWMPGGFIGVDIFFVISGYLISGIIFERLEKGNFSLREFYERRVIRIFPALFVVLGVVLVFGWFSLLASEYKQLGRYTIAGTLFSSNLLSWSDAGYFDANADEKPLLHLWSLGVEEQFYLVWPLALFLFYHPGNRIILQVGGVALFSLLINIISVQFDPIAAFYSPFSRFFELMAGAATAYFGQSKLKRFALREEAGMWCIVFKSNVISIIGAIAILSGLLLIDSRSRFPGFWVLLPTLGTMLLIQAGSLAWINRRILSFGPLVWIGLISYPLYLWHLPLLSFARIVTGGVPSREVRFLCLLVAVGLAWATFRFVELPVRRRAYHHASKALGPMVLSLIVAMAAICVAGGFVNWRNGFPARLPTLAAIEQARAKGSGEIKPESVGSPCEVAIPPSARCLLSTVPETEKLLVIGDSHGGALAPGIYQAIQELTPSISVVLQTEGGCSPLRGAESYDQLNISRNCREKYESVYRWAIEDPSVKTVILVSRWAERVGFGVGFGSVDGNLISGRYGYLEDGKEIKNNSEAFTRALRHTIFSLQANGKRVVFVHQVPEFGFYPPFCGRRPIPLNEWQEEKDRCFLDRGLVNKRQQEYRQLFDAVKVAFPNLWIMDPLPVFCNTARCSLQSGPTYFYRDNNHLNLDGAYLFGMKIVAELY
jgi:peptidoglycan/LPS O-acetylase OafA/YrhL